MFHKSLFLSALFTPALLATPVMGQKYSEYGNPLTRLTIKDILIRAEVVNTSEKIFLGLRHRQGLPEGNGMLFLMDVARPYRFFMPRDMLFSIDIIWIARGKVAGIHKNLLPGAKGSFTPPTPVRLVLEVTGGFADRHGFKVGDPVELQIAIPPSPAPWCRYKLAEKLDSKGRLLWAKCKNLLFNFLSRFCWR